MPIGHACRSLACLIGGGTAGQGSVGVKLTSDVVALGGPECLVSRLGRNLGGLGLVKLADQLIDGLRLADHLVIYGLHSLVFLDRDAGELKREEECF